MRESPTIYGLNYLKEVSHRLGKIFILRSKIGALCGTLGTFAPACAGESVPFNIRCYQDGDELLLEEACDTWGFPCHVATERNESDLIIKFVDDVDDGEHPGYTKRNFRCNKYAYSIRDTLVLSHEIGHFFGLNHICEGEECDDPIYEKYLMKGKNVTGDFISPEEFKVVEQETEEYLRKCTVLN